MPGTTPPNGEFERLVAEAARAPLEGWDFSYLNDRMTESALPWDYCARVRERMAGVTSTLDMGTGGGEILSSLVPLPPHTFATEAYAPNVIVARRRLAPLGVEVHDTTADLHGRHLPFPDAQFDLVINRHEEYIATEVWRILRPGGRFITQQCAEYCVDLAEWFLGKPFVDITDWLLEDVGFRVIDRQQAFLERAFFDVGAVVYYLRAVPWIVSDFTVERYKDRLFATHQHIQKHGRFITRDARSLLEAVKPG